MKSKLSYTLFILYGWNNIALAQSTPRPPVFDLDAIQVQIFLISDNYSGWDATDFMEHSKEGNTGNVGLPPDGFEIDYSNGGFLHNMYRLNFCLTPINRRTAQARNTRELRLGCSYFSEIENSVRYSLYEQEESDTIFQTYYFFHLSSDQIAVNGSYLFRTDPTNGIALYAGVGAGIGTSIESKILASYFFGYKHDFLTSPIETAEYEANAKRPVCFSTYVPFGIEFRVLKSWIVSMDANAGLNWQVYTGAANALRAQYAVGLGLKYSI